MHHRPLADQPKPDRSALPDSARLPGAPLSADGGGLLRDGGVQAGECREGRPAHGRGGEHADRVDDHRQKRPDRGQLRDLAGGQAGEF